MKRWIHKSGAALSTAVLIFTTSFGFTRQLYANDFELIDSIAVFFFESWENIGVECTVGPDAAGNQVCKDNQTCPKKKTAKAGFDPDTEYPHKCERTVWAVGKGTRQACECQPYKAAVTPGGNTATPTKKAGL